LTFQALAQALTSVSKSATLVGLEIAAIHAPRAATARALLAERLVRSIEGVVPATWRPA